MILAIVQARCSSTRLPGKVLAPVLGRPMVLRQIERLNRSTRIDRIVVATSVEPSDDPLVEVLEREGVLVRRGSLNDVASRFADVVAEFSPDSLVRLTADCPLADPDVIDRVIDEHLASGADYTSNTLNRTYPQGLDTECITASAFSRLMDMPLSDEEREHVTIGLYRRPEMFDLHSVVQDVDLSSLRWTVDRPDDLEFVRTIYGLLYDSNPAFSQADIVSLLEREPGLSHTN